MRIDLTRSDAWLGEDSEPVEGGVVLRHPDNPTYQWGNALLLDVPPTRETLLPALARAGALFAHTPSTHSMLRWDGPALDPPVRDLAHAHGLALDGGAALAASHLIPAAGPADIQPIALGRQTDALNIASDPSETDADPSYVAFKSGLRRSWARWVARGGAQWWSATIDGEHVGQCGMVFTPTGLARFQSVEVHPAYRRRGIARQLVSTVGAHALKTCHKALLAVDPDGPAMNLYRSLGFEPDGHQHCLLQGGGAHVFRLELPGDTSIAESITTAAFGRNDETRILQELRSEPETFVFVAVRDGTVDGVVAISGTQLPSTCALGPVAIRPSLQGRGVGTQLIHAALDEATRRGFRAAIVLGSPAYYGRFGFSAAAPITSRFDVPPGILQVRALVENGVEGLNGAVGYSKAFG